MENIESAELEYFIDKVVEVKTEIEGMKSMNRINKVLAVQQILKEQMKANDFVDILTKYMDDFITKEEFKTKIRALGITNREELETAFYIFFYVDKRNVDKDALDTL